MKRDWQIAATKKALEGVCRIEGCHETKVDAAHVVPRSIGGGMGENDTIPLCRDHHTEYDAHRLDLLPHLSYQEQAAAVKSIGIVRAYQLLCPSIFPSRTEVGTWREPKPGYRDDGHGCVEKIHPSEQAWEDR